MTLAPALRHHVADLLAAVRPDAPTLCEGWTTRDLAAHLVVRDRRPDAMPGIVIPAFAGHTEKVQDARAEKPYATLIDEVRSGPGKLSPMQVPAINERVNLVEYATHAEDIRRAQPTETQATLPPLPDGTEDAVWSSLTSMGKLLVRSSPVGVTLRAPQRGDVELKKPTDDGAVVLAGSPVDLMMHLSGRRDHSGVDVEGPDAAVAAFEQVKLGM